MSHTSPCPKRLAWFVSPSRPQWSRSLVGKWSTQAKSRGRIGFVFQTWPSGIAAKSSVAACLKLKGHGASIERCRRTRNQFRKRAASLPSTRKTRNVVTLVNLPAICIAHSVASLIEPSCWLRLNTPSALMNHTTASPTLNLAPFGRWTLRDKAAHRR